MAAFFLQRAGADSGGKRAGCVFAFENSLNATESLLTGTFSELWLQRTFKSNIATIFETLNFLLKKYFTRTHTEKLLTLRSFKMLMSLLFPQNSFEKFSIAASPIELYLWITVIV